MLLVKLILFVNFSFSRASSPEKQENPIITNYLNFLKNFSERAALNLPSSSNNFNNETEVSVSIQTPLINVEVGEVFQLFFYKRKTFISLLKNNYKAGKKKLNFKRVFGNFFFRVI